MKFTQYFLQIDIEAKLEHPFFVYGQGWASCHPEGSMTSFGLKCQRLQVGDVCISLKPREQKLEAQLSPMAQKRAMHQQHQQQQQQQQQHQREMYHQQVKEHHQQQQHQQQQQQQESMPQNLSRRPSNIPTTATDTSINSPMPPYSPALYNLQMSFLAAAGRIPSSYPQFMNEDTHMSHDSNTSLNNNNSTEKLPLMMMKAQEDYDDIQSRKRRWSAPEEVEEDQQQLQQSRKIAN
jgi:ataxin 1/1L